MNENTINTDVITSQHGVITGHHGEDSHHTSPEVHSNEHDSHNTESAINGENHEHDIHEEAEEK